MKIVINADYGEYGLSQAAANFLGLKPIKFEPGWRFDEPIYNDFNDDRTNPRLIECLETLGDKANGGYASLKIVDIPDLTTDYTIVNYDGWEEVLYVVDGHIFKAC